MFFKDFLKIKILFFTTEHLSLECCFQPEQLHGFPRGGVRFLRLCPGCHPLVLALRRRERGGAGTAQSSWGRGWGQPPPLPSLPTPKAQLEGSFCSLSFVSPRCHPTSLPCHISPGPYMKRLLRGTNTMIPLEMCFIKLAFLPGNLQLAQC